MNFDAPNGPAKRVTHVLLCMPGLREFRFLGRVDDVGVRHVKVISSTEWFDGTVLGNRQLEK